MERDLPQAFYLAAFERSAEALICVDDGRVVLRGNEAAAETLGIPRAALAGHRLDDWLDRPWKEAEEAIWQRVVGGAAERHETTLRRGDGSLRTFELAWSGAVVPGAHLAGLRDVTERHARDLMSERYELLSRHAIDIVLFIGNDGRILEANDAAARAYGYSREELLLLKVQDLREPSTLGNVKEQMDAAFATGVLFETVHRRRDGTTFPVEVGSRSTVVGGELVLLSVIRDITERREIHAKLLHADRLSVFGTLSASIAHEINNPLAYSITNVEVLARKLPELAARARRPLREGEPSVADGLDDSTRLLRIAQEGMGRVRSIVRDLRLFSHGDEETRTWTDLRAVLESSINVARGEIRHRARIARDYQDIPLVEVNASRMGQVFLNLLVNAAQAVPEGGDGLIRVSTRVTPEDRVVIEISDDGVGIPADLLPRIFEPFLTTKPPGEGTGLGLYIARTIVRAMRGELEVESEVGRGTTMRISLPCPIGPPPVRDDGTGHDETPAATRRARLLVVDDEVTIGLTLSALLEQAHDVVVSTSAADALVALERAGGARGFDAILCDVMMPGMTGVQLLGRIGERWPELTRRVIFMTGGASSVDARRFLEQTRAPCLQKPFGSDELTTALRDLLESASR